MTSLDSGRPSTALDFLASTKRSFSSSLNSRNFSFSPRQREKDLAKQRDLLERMVQERDEKISSLRKSVEVQDGHISKLHAKLEVSDRREKQSETRHEMQLESMSNDQDMLKAQLKLLQDEVQRIKSDPVRRALTQQGGAQDNEPFPRGPLGKLRVKVGGGNKEEKITLTGHAQGQILQGQLFQAMTSLTQLRQQTAVMKEHYDAIVKSLQDDLTLMSDNKAQEEAKLLNRIFALDQEKKVAEEALRDELRAKSARIRQMEKKLGKLEKIMEKKSPFGGDRGIDPDSDNDDSDSDDESDDGNGAEQRCDHTDRAVPGSVVGIKPEFAMKSKSSQTFATNGNFTFTGQTVKVISDARSEGSGVESTESPVSVLSASHIGGNGVKPSSSESTRSNSDVDLLRMSVKESQRRAKELLKISRSRRIMPETKSGVSE